MPLFSLCCHAPVTTKEPKICPVCNERVYETTTRPPSWYTGDPTYLQDKLRANGVYKRLSDPKWFTGVHRLRHEDRKKHRQSVDYKNSYLKAGHEAWRPSCSYADHSDPFSEKPQRRRSNSRNGRSPSATPRARSSSRSPAPLERYIDQVRVDALASPDRRRAQHVMDRMIEAHERSEQLPLEVHVAHEDPKIQQAKEVFQIIGLPTTNVAMYQDEIWREVKMAYFGGDVILASKIEDSFLILHNQEMRAKQQSTISQQGILREPTVVANLPEAVEAVNTPSNPQAGIKGQKFCTSCGNRLTRGDRFCPECGKGVAGSVVKNSGGVAITQGPQNSFRTSGESSPRSYPVADYPIRERSFLSREELLESSRAATRYAFM